MLRTIRRIQFFNSFFSELIRFTEKSAKRISSRWRVSGQIEIKVDNTVIFMFSNCDDPIVDSFYYDRQYQEISDLSLFIRLAKVSKVVLDIGAFTGLYSLFASRANRNCFVYSFEPNPVNFQRLILNVKKNQSKQVNCFQLAVGSHSTMIEFFSASNKEITDTSSANLSFSEASYSGAMNWEMQKVQQISVDDFVEREQIKKIDLVKIDAEHFELNVCKGMLRTVQKSRPVMLCEIFLDEERRDFFDSFIRSNNYFVYQVIHEGIIRLDDGIRPNHDGLNFIFAPGKTSQVYTSFKQIDLMVIELLKI